MAVVVTGGAGFIGSHVCESLLDQGKTVICIDNFNPYYAPEFKQDNITSCLGHKNFTLLKADITQWDILSKVFRRNKKCDVIHLAALTGIRDSLHREKLYEQVNVFGTLHMLLHARRAKASSFIFGSSSSVYGKMQTSFLEDFPTENPLHPYGASKIAGEMLCYSFSHKHRLPTTCLRFFSVYGERGRPDMAPYRFTSSILNNAPVVILGDGSARRDYTHVQDITRGIIAAIGKKSAYEIINLGNGKPKSILDLLQQIEKQTGRSAAIQFENPISEESTCTQAAIQKARMILNWKPRISFEEGMAQFVDWFSEYRAGS